MKITSQSSTSIQVKKYKIHVFSEMRMEWTEFWSNAASFLISIQGCIGLAKLAQIYSCLHDIFIPQICQSQDCRMLLWYDVEWRANNLRVMGSIRCAQGIHFAQPFSKDCRKQENVKVMIEHQKLVTLNLKK